MTRLFEPVGVRNISELIRNIPLYQTIDLQKFINDGQDTIDLISRFSNIIKQRNASIMFIDGGRSKESQQVEIFQYTLGLLNNPSETIDAYCLICEQSSVFSPEGKTWFGMNSKRNYQSDDTCHPVIFSNIFQCSRCKEQELLFTFKNDGELLTKIGQYPSERDLLNEEVRIYQKELGEYAPEFHTAIGLHSFGIGAGSFVYLRRIFENLIFNTFSNFKKDLSISEVEFYKMRMEDKIKSLSAHLPEFLVENRNLYGILSKGVHELSEKECLENFENVKLGIELILDEVIERKQKLAKIAKFTSVI